MGVIYYIILYFFLKNGGVKVIFNKVQSGEGQNDILKSRGR